MKKIERIEQGGSITVVHTEQIDQLESTVEELVGMMIQEVLEAEKTWLENYDDYLPSGKTSAQILEECHKANSSKIELIERAAGKPWDKIKKLQEEL